MIAFLSGQIIDIETDSVLLNVRGVGYEVLVSAPTAEGLKEKNQAQLWIYTHVREDVLALFGFLTKTERELFLSLIKINGIGPKVAMKILSGATLENLIRMIDESDVTALSKLPKVGKKTAEQIVLALKGKLVIAAEDGGRARVTVKSDIVSALVNLGFKIQDVERVVGQMEPSTEFEDGIKKGLAALSGAF